MKMIINYKKPMTQVIEVPRKYQFYFLKDEDDYTDEEWDLAEEFYDWKTAHFGEDSEIEDIIE